VLAPAPISVYKEIGRAVAAAITETHAEAVIMASSDMTHYEPHDTARKKDSSAIEAIVELDEDELMRRVQDLRISMCGYAPTVALISAAKELGATRAELVKYQTSGDVSRDYGSVVGYAGIVIAR
jgi:AmmeMemoRadiSam system protein B